MKIIGWEVRKIFTDKALWLLLFVCMALVIAAVLPSGYDREGLVSWNALIAQTGTQITPESVEKLESIAREAEEDLAVGRPTLGAYDLFTSSPRLDQINSLISTARSVLETEQDFAPDGLIPAAADNESEQTVLEKYRDSAIRARAEQANASGERDYFSLGYFLSAREDLFSLVFPLFFAAMILAAGYLTARSASLEFAEGTQQLVYTSRRGRALQRSKLAACLIAVTAVYWACAAVLLGAWLAVCPQGAYLALPFSADPFAPALSRFPVSFAGYMTLQLGMGFLIVLALSLLMFGLTARGHSPAIGIAVFCAAGIAMAAAGLIQQPELFPVAVNPVSLLFSLSLQGTININSGDWFCYTGKPLSLPHIELISVLLWAALFALLCIAMLRRFQKREVS